MEDKQKYVIIGLLIALALIIIVAIVQTIMDSVNVSYFYDNPYESVEVLGNKVRIRSNVKEYFVETTCANITPETELIYTNLAEDYKGANITTTKYVFSNNTLLTDKYYNVSDIFMTVNLELNKGTKNYNHLYSFKISCTDSLSEEDYQNYLEELEEQAKKAEKENKKKK